MNIALWSQLPTRWDGKPFVVRITDKPREDVGPDVSARSALLVEPATISRVIEEWRGLQKGVRVVLVRGELPDVQNLALGNALAVPVVVLPPALHYLEPGDIVRIDPRRGDLQTIFRSASPFNHLFVTERCNSKCLMCSQPPRAVDDGFRAEDLLHAIPLIPASTSSLGFTGGEITLLGERFLDLLRSVRKHLPDTHIQVLSNGRLFTYLRLAQEVADVGIKSLILCVPLYSDVDAHHDFVVQARGAFDQTLRGLLNLGRVGVPVEIRVVLSQQTVQRLPELAQFIARNLPFASHIALMGLEMTGYTRANMQALWIDPIEYTGQLEEAVDILDAAGLRVSIFNHQLCLIPPSLWRFSRQSISDWKNIYLPQCQGCTLRNQCGGFFASATRRHSDHIRPFHEESVTLR